MAIQFARCQYVSRSTGGNACRKASYNQREVVRCERTGQVFSFKDRGDNVHHEILLPVGADPRFNSSSVLWNEAERCERRVDSQVAKEFVIALPDDAEVTFEDRVELSRMFAQIFVRKGVAVQFDIHEPHEGDKNWHSHFLVTTRRFSEDGQTFHSRKAVDLDPVFRKGVVVEADVWGEIWRDLQNAYFEEKGYDIRVDPIGVIPQEHLGPVRMRHHMNEAILRSQMLQKANETLSQDPGNVIEAVVEQKAIFTSKDIEMFLNKHVPFNEREGLLERVLDHKTVMPLYDKETGQKTAYYTTQEVRSEEEKLIRFADSIANRPREGLGVEILSIPSPKGGTDKKTTITLSSEQRAAYEHCVNSDRNLCIIQGRAGVGKSTVLKPIREAHENKGYRVLGLAPTHKVAQDLKADGFEEATTCHAFLFAYKNNRETLDSKTLVVIDEAGMLGTELSVELLHAVKTKGAKLLLVGDDRQLSSINRGGVFGFLAERYGASELKEVRRQSISWQKQVSEDLSQGDIKNAVTLMDENKALNWTDTKEEALSNLLKDWAKESVNHPSSRPQSTQLILAQRNVDVDALNEGARDILKQKGKLGDIEVTCQTQRGNASFAVGDRIHFTKTDKSQGLTNGQFGTIQHIDTKTKKLSILTDSKENKEVNPHTYDGLKHGYASTVYKAQGSTLEHVFVLHSRMINRSVNYVALTRQTKSLSLYVVKDETPSQHHLIRQMSREEKHKTSLAFDTQKDIELRHAEIMNIQANTYGHKLTTTLKKGTEKLLTTVKDFFHTNEEFYKVDAPEQKIQKSDVTLSTRAEAKLPKESQRALPSYEASRTSSDQRQSSSKSSGLEKHHTPSPTVSEDVKRAMLGDEFYNKIYRPKAEPAGKSLSSQEISEDLKKTMLGENFYNKDHGKKEASRKEQFLKTTALQKPEIAKHTEKFSRTGSESKTVKDTTSEEQKTTLSYKPPSPGKRR